MSEESAGRDLYMAELRKQKTRRNVKAIMAVGESLRNLDTRDEGRLQDRDLFSLESIAEYKDEMPQKQDIFSAKGDLSDTTHSKRSTGTTGTKRTHTLDKEAASILQRNDIMATLKELGASTLSLTGEDNEAHPGRIPFYAYPEQRQRWGDDQVLPHINWGDLFFDLFYVAAAYNLGTMLISAMTPTLYLRGVMYFIGIFGALFNMWESKLVFEARYTVIDYAHQILEVIRVFFLFFSVLHIKTIDLMSDPRSAETFLFTMGVFLESIVHIILKVELMCVGKGDVEAIRNHSKWKILYHFLPMSLLYLAAVLVSGILYLRPDEDAGSDGHLRLLGPATDKSSEDGLTAVSDVPIALCLIAYLLNIITTGVRKACILPKAGDFRKFNVPSNIDFCIHRYGEWVMLMLGEAVLSLLIVETTEERDYYVVAILGTLTVILLQAIKFESQPSHAEGHALWRSIKAGYLYSGLIQLLSMGLIAFGVSFKVFLYSIHSETYKSDYDAYESDNGEETNYDENSKYGERHRNLAPSGSVTDTAMSALFCASLTVVLFSLELMASSHKGTLENYGFNKVLHHTESRGRIKWRLVFLGALKIVLLVFTATLSQWLTDPTWVTAVGFLVVVCFAGSTAVAWGLLHKHETEHAGNHHGKNEKVENNNHDATSLKLKPGFDENGSDNGLKAPVLGRHTTC